MKQISASKPMGVKIDLMEHSQYRKEWEKLQDLRSRITDAEVEAEKLHNEGVGMDYKTHRKEQIEVILAGGSPSIVNQEEKWREDLRAARSRIHLLKDAEKSQEEIISKQRFETSKKVAKEVQPMYEEIVKQMAKKWIELGQLVIREIDLRESLNVNHIAYSAYFTPMVFYGMGDPRVYNSRYSAWIIECVERGYLSAQDVPKSLKDIWLKRDGFTFKNTI